MKVEDLVAGEIYSMSAGEVYELNPDGTTGALRFNGIDFEAIPTDHYRKFGERRLRRFDMLDLEFYLWVKDDDDLEIEEE